MKNHGAYLGLFKAEWLVKSKQPLIGGWGYGSIVELECAPLVNATASIKVAQAFGVMASILGGIIMCLSISQFFLKLPTVTFHGGAITLIVCFIFQLITFSAFAACNGHCQISRDGIFSIFAALFYLFAAPTMFMSPVIDAQNDNDEVLRENLVDDTVEETPPIV